MARDAGQPAPQRQPPAAALMALPAELIDAIVAYLSAYDLVAVSATCHGLRKHAMSEFHWQRCVQDHVPCQAVTSPGPCASFRELYAAHDLRWFLPEYRIWFCDRTVTGSLVLARFDPRRGCIEGYRLVAYNLLQTASRPWPANPDVVIHGFKPRIGLHMDKPILAFRVGEKHGQGAFSLGPVENRFADEMLMELEERMGGVYSTFLLTRRPDAETVDAETVDAERVEQKLAAGDGMGDFWPPHAIPTRHHVSSMRPGRASIPLPPDERPWARSEVSDQTFRIRRWMEMAGRPASRSAVSGRPVAFARYMEALEREGRALATHSAAQPGTMAVHMGEEMLTYATLNAELYTPSPTKPWRGIWVGDYNMHGCEFLLIHQPDDGPVTDAELGLVRGEHETDAGWEQRRLDARVYRGRLEAIKLTGDPHVPRGEYSFVVDDLGPGGYVGTATDKPFVGARMVQSKGHVAGPGFMDDAYIASQLFLISTNRLAVYWVGIGHISFLQRVRLDNFVFP